MDKHEHIISAARRRLARGAATVLLALACGVSGGLEGAAQTLSADPGIKPNAPLDPNRPLTQELNTSTGSALNVQAVGSLTISSPIAALPAFDPAVVALLMGSAQPAVSFVTVADLETSLLDSSFKGYPYGPDGVRPPSAGPSVADQLKTLGLDLLSRANEHALDWGIDGMQATGAALDAAELIHAGTGLTGGQARSARYYDDPLGRGRIALVSAASTFRPTSEALQAQGAAPGRPGVSGLEVYPVGLVSQDELTRLQQIACTFEYYGQSHDCSKDPTPASVTALGATFEAAASALQHTTNNRLNRLQAQDMLRFVRAGRENADYLVVALRADQLDDARSATPRPPKFLEEMAHAAVDSGADMVTMTGRPTLGAIEIYRAKGRPPRPVFYGLGNFYWSPGQGPAGADPTNTWSVIARTNIVRNQLLVELYPIDLSADATHIAGSPRLADKALATTILQRLIRLSAPHEVEIRIEASGATVKGRIFEEGVGGGDKP